MSAIQDALSQTQRLLVRQGKAWSSRANVMAKKANRWYWAIAAAVLVGYLAYVAVLFGVYRSADESQRQAYRTASESAFELRAEVYSLIELAEAVGKDSFIVDHRQDYLAELEIRYAHIGDLLSPLDKLPKQSSEEASDFAKLAIDVRGFVQSSQALLVKFFISGNVNQRSESEAAQTEQLVAFGTTLLGDIDTAAAVFSSKADSINAANGLPVIALIAGGSLVLLALSLAYLISRMGALREKYYMLKDEVTYDTQVGVLSENGFRDIASQRLKDGGDLQQFALVAVEFDQFSVIKNSNPSDCWPGYLQWAAEEIREIFNQKVVVGRRDSDGLYLLIDGQNLKTLRRNMEEILDKFRFSRYSNCGRVCQSTVSLGLAVMQGVGDSQQLVLDADIACLVALEAGRDRYHITIHGGQRESTVKEDLRTGYRVSEAIEKGELALVHQRIVGLASPTTHCEILLREKSGDELLSPGRLISAAEKYGTIKTLDRWVVNNTFEAIRAGRLDDIDMVAINFSRMSLGCPYFGKFLISKLRENPDVARRICIEVTETSESRDINQIRSLLIAARAEGCKVALDDFGTGSSSFKCLKRLPVDFIKIDGDFIRRVELDVCNRVIVESIVAVAAALDVQTIAECVETDRERRCLELLGVNFMQGFAVHEPEEIRSDRLPGEIFSPAPEHLKHQDSSNDNHISDAQIA